MANKTMHHLVIGDNNYEILDAKNRANIAAEYSASSTYNVGDVVLYNGQLYKCTTAISTAEAWTAAHWTAVTVGEKIANLEDDTNQLKEDKADIDSAYVTDTASGSIASFPDGADDVPVKSLSVAIEPVQSGTGDPSPTNIRPISGHTQAVVTRTGKNLLPITGTTRTVNGITFTVNADGTITASGTATAEASFLVFDKNTYGSKIIIKSGSYVLSGCPEGGGSSTYRISSNGFLGWGTTGSDSQATLTGSENQTNILIIISNGLTVNNLVFKPMIRLAADTDSTFEPYTAQTVTIDLDGTIYGGTLDVSTGVLTVDRELVDLGTLTWIESSTSVTGVKEFLSQEIKNAVKKPANNGTVANVICENYKTVTAENTWMGVIGIAIRADGSVLCDNTTHYTDASAFKTAMDGVQLAYEIANPFTVQLTANNIKTLLGTNNIWSDAGNVDVEYRADTKLYIEKLTAPTEDDMIADHAISANTFFMIGNTLYRATTAIASGATITVGTNATKLSLSDALNALA